MSLIALLVLTAEFLIMVLIEIVLKPIVGPNLSATFWDFLDPLLLIVIVTPWIYVLAVRPVDVLIKVLLRLFVVFVKA